MKNFFVLIFLISLSAAFAQTVSVKGKVIADNAQPIAGANIIVVETNQGDATDENGFFEIENLSAGTYTLEISCIGYEKRKVTYAVGSGMKKIFTIVLKETAFETEQIVVSASKYEQKLEDLTVSTTVIKSEFINRKNFLSFDDMLRYVPGVQMNLEQVSIRGSSGYSKGVGARVLVAINGIPLYSGDNGDVVWELIPLADIERVEVIKGPASSLYGSSAIGGVINIITKQTSKNSLTHFKSYIGAYDKPSYDIWKWDDSYRTFYGTELTHSNSFGSLGYTLAIKKFDNFGYRQNDYYKRYLGYVKLNYTLSPGSYLTIFSDYLYSNRGNFLYWKDSRNALVPKDEDNGNYVKSYRSFNGLIYHSTLSPKLSADLKATYYRTKFDGYGVELTTSTANLYRAEILTNYTASEKFILTTGAELSYAKVSSNIFSNTNFFGTGLYSQFDYKGIDRLTASFGFRYDYFKLDTIGGKNAFTPRAGLNYKLDDNFILRASVGTGFRAPTPAEVFTTAGVGGGIDVKENPNLTSETSISFELGMLFNYTNNFSVDAAFYRTDYDNFIEPNLTKEGDIQFVNLSQARIQGFEAVVDWSPLPNELQLIVGYNYMWARDIEKNKAMKYRPRNVVYSQLKYSPGHFDFGIDFRYMSKVEEIDFALTEAPLVLVKDGAKRVPVYVTDFTAGYNLLISGVPAKIYLNAKNIFNYYYVEFIGNIAPIRNISISTEIYF
ncbi:MAG: TonB-dependent receptor [Ignavibacteriales bacterium]|nr:TonB-dependent receptor [Ignavibacteriales bacterium]